MSRLPLILASGSPRRRELLEKMGVRFEVVTAAVTELDAVTAPQLGPAALAVENARRKMEEVARLRPGRWVLGADTVVALGGRIFGKPASVPEARDFLRALSGRTHEVVTGVALRGPAGEDDSFDEVSRVTFRALDEEAITRYLAAVEVLDKAGGYALQERGEWLGAVVEGSRTNVVGLPVEKLGALLSRRGLL